MADVKILLVLDESNSAVDIKSTLKYFGYQIPYVTSSCKDAADKSLEIMPDLILMDILLKGSIDCIESASKIRKLNIPLIYLTTNSQDFTVKRSKLKEPFGYMIKPYDSVELKYALELALYKNKMEKELNESEKSYRELVNNSMVAIYKTNLNGDIIFANNAMAELFDFRSVKSLQRKKITQLYKDPDDRKKIIQKLQKEGNISHYEVNMVSNSGEKIIILLSAQLEGELISGMMLDITKRKKAEEDLHDSEKKYKSLFEVNPEYTILLGENGIILDVNNATISLTGLSKKEIVGKNFSELEIILPEDLKTQLDNVQRLLKGESIEPFESRFIDKNGVIKWVIVHLTTIRKNNKINYILGIASDITEQKVAEIKLNSSLNEKNNLLQEIHHRVKNNMQIISSLLNLQKQYVNDDEAVNVLQESQNRVKSMAMVHEKIYLSEDLAHINFGDYIQSLVSNLFYSYTVDKSRIRSVFKIDDVNLNIETAVPCGLIISELVSNGLKHAFPNEMKGRILISLKADGDKYELIICDNGIGLPKGLGINNLESLGLLLVKNLTNQIDGRIYVNNNHGTEFKIIFKELKYKERI
jgi:two-component system, sensor histidine kinase PdtaS